MISDAMKAKMKEQIELLIESSAYYTGSSRGNAVSDSLLDLETAAEIMVEKAIEQDPSYEFESFGDIPISAAMRALVKDKEQFNSVLASNSMVFEDFISACVQLSPHCFDTALIKTLRKDYLGLNPVLPKYRKWKLSKTYMKEPVDD